MGKEKVLYNLLKRFIKDETNYVESKYGVSQNSLYLDGSIEYKSEEEKEKITIRLKIVAKFNVNEIVI